jgi:hypothetical protein
MGATGSFFITHRLSQNTYGLRQPTPNSFSKLPETRWQPQPRCLTFSSCQTVGSLHAGAHELWVTWNYSKPRIKSREWLKRFEPRCRVRRTLQGLGSETSVANVFRHWQGGLRHSRTLPIPKSNSLRGRRKPLKPVGSLLRKWRETWWSKSMRPLLIVMA